MFNNQVKTIEENAISLLNMRKREGTVDLKKDVHELLVELFTLNNTMLSEITLNRLVRHIINYIQGANITRQNADDVILMTLRQIGMENLIENYKEIVK